jgi:hypothetical protein
MRESNRKFRSRAVVGFVGGLHGHNGRETTSPSGSEGDGITGGGAQ